MMFDYFHIYILRCVIRFMDWLSSFNNYFIRFCFVNGVWCTFPEQLLKSYGTVRLVVSPLGLDAVSEAAFVASYVFSIHKMIEHLL